MNFKKGHYTSGLIITFFVILHLINHSFSICGADKHIEAMKLLRPFYRNIISETILFFAIVFQIYSGLKFFNTNRKTAQTFFDKLQIWTGLYLATFFVIHLTAVVFGRLVLHLDTNFYFGVAGLNSFPTNLFFIPYYSLAIISFFGHVAAIHSKKMRQHLFGIAPIAQAKFILTIGVVLTFVLIWGLTNRFQGVEIPVEYKILIGK